MSFTALRRQRGFVFEHVRGVVRVAEQRRALGTQFHDLRDEIRSCRTRRPSRAPIDALVDAFAQCAIPELRQRRLAGRVEQRNDPFAFELARLRGFGSDRDLLVRPAFELGAVVDHDRARVDAIEHGLPELGRQRRELLVHLAQLLLVRIGELRAGAHERGLVALQQAQRFRIELQRVALLDTGLARARTAPGRGRSHLNAPTASAPFRSGPFPARDSCSPSVRLLKT